MNATHTPGPWRTGVDVENCGGGMNVLAADDSLRVAHTARFVRGGEVLISEPVAKANAHLIAAAPELLEALKACVSDHDQLAAQQVYPEEPMPCGCKVCQQMKHAIAKAEGRA